ncbi:hypothetical protein PGT21_019658 [Puccinia graminis f. sp. tritici]|uniref:Uncharacterized protein n=1 Tax=Puccinia graminis f. sp. tritici TaxID=56615 RepID=A0A5B0PK37_PUCGR|nr:hypothetical protein PGT21_019658 [Puccinia graminis f. sp. tritici]KAA1136432.1 hypothetical protein PGTUg99_031598 [Puccinia graminis f. sp. tritici]
MTYTRTNQPHDRHIHEPIAKSTMSCHDTVEEVAGSPPTPTWPDGPSTITRPDGPSDHPKRPSVSQPSTVPHLQVNQQQQPHRMHLVVEASATLPT